MRIGRPARTARHTVCLSRPPCGTPVAATLPGALSCPPPRPFRQRASPEQREAPLRNHSTHIRTVSGGSPAIFRPLTPLTVPLLLKPLFLLDGAGPRLCGLWAEEDWTPRLLARSSEVLAVANRLAFDGFDVDHVAVTPAGARGGDQMGGQPERRALVGRARPSGRGRRTQDPLAAAQQTIGRSDLPVVPVLVLWGPGSRTLKGQAVEWDGVTVLPGPDAQPLLSRWAHRPGHGGRCREVETGLAAFIAMRERAERSKPVGSARTISTTVRRP